jgi:hypothetical protein
LLIGWKQDKNREEDIESRLGLDGRRNLLVDELDL